MKTIHLDPHQISYRQLRNAGDALLGGGVIVYPTDTIYGLGCDIYAKDAVKKIYALKKRDSSKPFSFICGNVSQISEFAFVSNWGYKLLKKSLPGPYTFILEARKTNMPKKMLGKRNTIGVRIPDHPVCRELVRLTGRPLLTTSVNLSGEGSLTDPSMLPEKFSSKVDLVISTGPLVSEPSTVIDIAGDEPVLIRQGKGELLW
ncbi:MAG TPA: threonylcarbamoyl-AMP synthase [Nitrospirae bacterium]|nr:threonylcarbamoyl-AMP synthase [Nitrospirota bacterium]